MHVVGVGTKGREVLGLPAVFIYSSKICIEVQMNFAKVKPTKLSETELIRMPERDVSEMIAYGQIINN